jgi:RHS repeat-associated protein
MSYLYDPDGRRVARLQNGAVVKQYYYDAAGHMITEADASGATLRAEIYAGNRHLATWNGGTTYFNHADWLGTERVRTNTWGTACEWITSLPFGDGETTSGSCAPTPTFFTGKERDSESGLDYFGARYNSSSIGRFSTPDPLMASARVSDPQSWNRYTYGRNNPLKFFDPTGMTEETAGECAKDKLCLTVKLNVIYDTKANEGKGLTDEQKAAFQKQLQEAKDEYGNAHIHFDVAYGTGIQKGVENVVVSDSTPDLAAGESTLTRSGFAVTYLDVTQGDKETLSLELAHQFMGDTTGLANAFSRWEGTGISNMVFDTYFDTRNDLARMGLKANDWRSMNWRLTMGPASNYIEGPNEDFRRGAIEFQKEIRPRQE